MALTLRQFLAHIKIMILTGIEVDDCVFDLITAGMEGYTMKNIEPGKLEVLEWLAMSNTYR